MLIWSSGDPTKVVAAVEPPVGLVLPSRLMASAVRQDGVSSE